MANYKLECDTASIVGIAQSEMERTPVWETGDETRDRPLLLVVRAKRNRGEEKAGDR